LENPEKVTVSNKKPELHLIICAENFGKGYVNNYTKNEDLIAFADEVLKYIDDNNVRLPEKDMDDFVSKIDAYETAPCLKTQELLLKIMAPVVETLESEAVIFEKKTPVKKYFI
jgi:hypothetical protein